MKNKYYGWGSLLFLSLGFIPICEALQTIEVKENQTAFASLAQKELTRIAIFHDRIQDVRGPEHKYDLKTDVKQGAIFLKLLPDATNDPFTLFLTTEQHHNYVLALTPKPISADTVLLKPKAMIPASIKERVGYSSYSEALKQLVIAMMHGRQPKGYRLIDLSLPEQKSNTSFIVKPLLRYQGKALEGTVYQLQNRTDQSLHLQEAEFFQEGDLAIALSSNEIMPHSQIRLLKVKSHESTIASD